MTLFGERLPPSPDAEPNFESLQSCREPLKGFLTEFLKIVDKTRRKKHLSPVSDEEVLELSVALKEAKRLQIFPTPNGPSEEARGFLRSETIRIFGTPFDIFDAGRERRNGKNALTLLQDCLD